MKLNLPECSERVFDPSSGTIICSETGYIRTVEDCIACNLENEDCSSDTKYDGTYVLKITNDYKNKIDKITLQRNILFYISCLVILYLILLIIFVI